MGDNVITDKERIDYLQSLLDKKLYTGKAILRLSTRHCGFRLHETSRQDAFESVRDAIDDFIRKRENGLF
jgi:hypothetical protein